MDSMFKIGDFSKLCQVTVKTLRHYDDLGLFKPIEVDQFTGYRFYSADQVLRLYRILALKNLGLTLEQIALIIDGDLPVEKIRGILRQQQVELQQHLVEEEARLTRVEILLRQIEKEDIMTTYEVILKEIPEIRVASVRGIIPTYGDICQLFDVLCPYLFQVKAAFVGPAMAIYYDHEYREREVDVEVAVPITGEVPDHPRVKTRNLPLIRQAASIIHSGPYESFVDSYRHLMKWIQVNQLQIVGFNREIYLRGPNDTSNPDEYITEIQVPVEKV